MKFQCYFNPTKGRVLNAFLFFFFLSLISCLGFLLIFFNNKPQRHVARIVLQLAHCHSFYASSIFIYSSIVLTPYSSFIIFYFIFELLILYQIVLFVSQFLMSFIFLFNPYFAIVSLYCLLFHNFCSIYLLSLTNAISPLYDM